MNKSVLTNIVSLLLALAGWLLPGIGGMLLLNTGLYALSGGVTNWLAVYMLFEKVPGFYGSGVIPARFEEFRGGIRQLVMEQFFTEDNLRRFLAGADDAGKPALLDTLMEKVDFDEAFDQLVDVIRQSSFGGMLAMVGGDKALQPLRAPFIARMQDFLRRTSEDPQIIEQFGHDGAGRILERVEHIVESRLQELTPQMVKEIVQNMISRHLGWLVVWGGVVGGMIGLLVGVAGLE